MKVVLVYNAGAGNYSSVQDLKKVFAESSIEITDLIKIAPGLKTSLKRHIQKGEIIAVIGGDGSISTVASLLKDTKATLMPLPGGTLNHFTKDLGIPQSLPDALEYFKSAKKVTIDTGQINGKTFINNSSIGIYSDSLLDRDEHEKKFGKWPSMITSALTTLFRFRTYTVELDGKRYSTPLIFVGNNRYKPKGLTVQRAKLTEGTLSVYMVIGKSRWNLFWAMAGVALGKKSVYKKLKSFSAQSVVIRTRKPVRISRDGEHEKTTSPLHYKVNKSSLSVLQVR